MKVSKNRFLHSCGMLPAAILMASCSAVAAADTTAEADPGWQFGFDLYLWLPSVSGELRFEPSGAGDGQEVDIDQFIDALQMAFMGTFAVRKGAWSGFTDLLYMRIGGDRSKTVTVPDGTSQTLAEGELDLSTGVWTLAAAYSPWHSGNSHLDILFGARMLGLDTDFKLTGLGPDQREQKLSESQDFWDGIVGVKGRAGINEHWFVPYYLDLGTGESDFTWQAAAGIGYSFGWGDIVLDYRHLEYSQGGNSLVQDLALSGGRLGFVLLF